MNQRGRKARGEGEGVEEHEGRRSMHQRGEEEGEEEQEEWSDGIMRWLVPPAPAGRPGIPPSSS